MDNLKGVYFHDGWKNLTIATDEAERLLSEEFHDIIENQMERNREYNYDSIYLSWAIRKFKSKCCIDGAAAVQKIVKILEDGGWTKWNSIDTASKEWKYSVLPVDAQQPFPIRLMAALRHVLTENFLRQSLHWKEPVSTQFSLTQARMAWQLGRSARRANGSTPMDSLAPSSSGNRAQTPSGDLSWIRAARGSSQRAPSRPAARTGAYPSLIPAFGPLRALPCGCPGSPPRGGGTGPSQRPWPPRWPAFGLQARKR
jgi:hypothetical protein